MPPKSKRAATVTSGAHSYAHDNKAVQRPDVGLQQEFLKVRKPPKTYRYDSSLDPALSWDENPGREQAEWLLGLIERCAEDGEGVVFAEEQLSANGRIRVGSLKSCVAMLKNLSQPFLNWSGKAERADIQVPTLPLFVHERHSTKAIIDGLVNHKAKGSNLDLFGDPGLDLTDKLRAYEHVGPWTNRMILGDSLVAMNSLLEYEGLGGQVQMIYIDPPYGVKFGSNFQPFVRSKPGCGSARDVKHGADDAMTREPEMVKAYRDTWELGLHSYLAYLRDRLLLARELLTDSGSVFVQISDENLHHVRHLLDEVFGPENFASQITFQKTSGSTTATIPTTSDYLLWYAKDIQCVKFHKLYVPQVPGAPGAMEYKRVELADGALHPIGRFRDDAGVLRLPDGAQIFATDSIVSKGGDDEDVVVEWEGKKYRLSCKPNRHWKCGADGVTKLWDKGRLLRQEGLRIFKRYLSDFPFRELVHVWTDTRGEDDPAYVVQTDIKPIERCVLMTTDPGDLVLDPTCGSGTTACVAEQWGRRWITIDTSRVPLALARQRLLTATFPYYELLSPNIGPRGGFVYQRKQNRKGEEIGGLVPHITLKSIANNEEPALEVLVDRPEVVKDVTRVSGPFTVEALMPAAAELDETKPPAAEAGEPAIADASGEYAGNHIDRMVRVLKLSKTLRLPENRTLVFDRVRGLDGFDYLQAEAEEQNGNDKRIAIVFGPPDGAIGSETVYAAAEEAKDAGYAKLYFFGFAIQAKAREMIEDRGRKKLPCAFITVTPDVLMSDLLKTTRASEIFSVTGLPDIEVVQLPNSGATGAMLYQVKLKGLDIFNPATLKTEDVEAEDLPCWMLDSDYDGLSFYATQVFFPKTSAWENLKKSLKAEFDESLWAHLSGTVSEPFPLGQRRRVAVKVIDERGNELMVVREVAP